MLNDSAPSQRELKHSTDTVIRLSTVKSSGECSTSTKDLYPFPVAMLTPVVDLLPESSTLIAVWTSLLNKLLEDERWKIGSARRAENAITSIGIQTYASDA